MTPVSSIFSFAWPWLSRDIARPCRSVFEGGAWAASLDIGARLYDAGSRTGETYRGPRADVNPKGDITYRTAPPFDAREFAIALQEKARPTRKLRDAVTLIKLAADRLDRAGDAKDAARVRRYYGEFTKGLKAILELFPPSAE